MNRSWSTTTAVAAALTAAAAALGPSAQATDLAPQDVATYVVQYEPRSGDDVLGDLRARGLEPIEDFSELDALSVEMTAAQAAALAAADSTVTVEPDVPVSVTGTQTDPPWGLDRIDQPELPLSRSYTYPSRAGAGVRVYVVDTGVNPDPTFEDRFLPGYNAMPDAGPDGTADCHGHGTHVAGTVASSTFGVAKAADVVPVRVLDCNGSGTSTSVLAGLDWIAANHPAGTPGVVNMSLGSARYAATDASVATLVSHGLTVVVAAGNDYGADACGRSPAGEPLAVTVASSNRTDTPSDFSNVGSCVDTWAPGEDIVSLYTIPGWQVSKSGTSMASPHVAGIAALYLSYVPQATPAEVTTALLGAARPRIATAPAGTTTSLVTSRVVPPPSAPSAPSVTSTASGATVTWTSTSQGTAADGFTVHHRAVGATAWTAAARTPSTRATLTGLTPGAAYEVAVSASNEHGTGALSATTTFTYQDTPSAPTSVTATGAHLTGGTVRWAPPTIGASFVTGYAVTITRDGATTITAELDASARGYTAVGLSPGTAYGVRVAARSRTGAETWSQQVALRTADTPSAPVDVRATAVGATGATVSWGAPTTSGHLVTGYVVERSTDGQTWSTAATAAGSARTATLAGLTAGATTWVRVTAHVGAHAGPASAAAPVRRLAATPAYVTSVYDRLFGRSPDTGGLTAWTGALTAGTPRGAVADAITSSPEYRSRLIAGSYRTYLGRTPDPQGLASWLSAMGSGLTIQGMESGFVASPEYYLQSGSTPAGWVTRLYRDVLGRDPGAAEVQYWAGRLNAGMPRAQVATGFLLSTEHLATVVDGHYRHLLGRSLDPSGSTSWVRAIQGGTRVEAVIAGIIASPEYWTRNT